jgi:hypothetical protein
MQAVLCTAFPFFSAFLPSCKRVWWNPDTLGTKKCNHIVMGTLTYGHLGCVTNAQQHNHTVMGPWVCTFRAWVHDKCEVQHASSSSGIRKLVKNQQKWQTVYVTSSGSLNPWWPCHILAQLYPKLFKRPDWSNLQKVTAAREPWELFPLPTFWPLNELRTIH